MIAPDPALAGPLPPAPQREILRAAGAERRRGEDFASLLDTPTAEEPGRAEDLPEPAVPVAPDPLQALAAPPPAAAVPTAPAQSAEPPDAVLAPVATGPEPALLPSVPVPGASAPEPAAAEAAGIVSAVASKPAARPGQGPPPAPLPVLSAQKASAGERPVAEPAETPEPERTERPPAEPAPEPRPIEAKAGDRSEGAPPLPPGGEARRPPMLVEAAAPAWHLRPEGQVPPRPEPGAPAPAQPPVPAVAPQAVVGQVAVAIGRASDESVELRLDPPELGRVQIHLSRHDGAVQAVVLADRPETQDLLRRHAEVLARELGEAGYDSVSLDFAGGGAEPRPGEPGARDWAQALQPLVVEPAALPAEIVPRARPAGRLDVRL